jgi:hypothetical protein
MVVRPRIGRLLPVFVVDEYEGFEVKRFVDLTDGELEDYLNTNADALRAAATWHGSEVVIAGHAIPGSVVALRALGPLRYVTKIHGSDLEYAIRPARRYLDLAREGLPAGRAVTGSSDDVLRRCVELVPEIVDRVRTVSPGVDVERPGPPPRPRPLPDRRPSGGRPTPFAASPTGSTGSRGGAERRAPAALDDLAGKVRPGVPDPGRPHACERSQPSTRCLSGTSAS